MYQNLEYTQWKSDQRENLKSIPWIIPECSENTEDLYSPIRSVSDTMLWCFIDKSGKNSAISPFIPIPTEPLKSSPIRALSSIQLSNLAPEFEPKKMTSSKPITRKESSPAVSYGYTPIFQSTTLAQTNECMTGRLKCFDEAQQYGFFVLDRDGTDLFVHQDDLEKSGITAQELQKSKEAWHEADMFP